MRGRIDGLANPHPMGARLPGVLQQDDLTQRLTAALDEVLAPALWVLDNVDAYLDPQLAPLDFVGWLAGIVGVELDETWPEARQRDLVAHAVELYAWRGTARGIAELVETYTGAEVDVADSGGVTWSAVPGGQPPGQAAPTVRVRVRAIDPEAIDRARVEGLVAEAKPAHVVHTVEVVQR